MAVLENKVTLEFAALGRTITWQATPKISQGITVNYSTWELQHTNYQPSAFGNRGTPEITISGPWFSRSADEAKVTLEAIHTLRTATMMYYGRGDDKKGTPPPVGRFSAYGLYNRVPVVIKSFQFEFPNDVDYVTTPMFTGGGNPPTEKNQEGLGDQNGPGTSSTAEGSKPGPGNDGNAQAVPVLFDISVVLLVQMSPVEVVKRFTLAKFNDGSLLGEGYI